MTCNDNSCNQCNCEQKVEEFQTYCLKCNTTIGKCKCIWNEIRSLCKKVDELQSTKSQSDVCAKTYTEIQEKINKLEAARKIHADNYATNNSNTMKRITAIEEKISEKYAHPDVIDRIERLESRYESFASTQLKYENWNKYLENNLQIKDNIPLSIQHEIKFEEWDKGMVKIVERLNKLEEEIEINDDSCEDAYFELKNSIDSLTEMYKELSLKHVKLIDIELNKTPHKCPVCDGIGMVKSYMGIKDISGCAGFECNACEGKGIVWG